MHISFFQTLGHLRAKIARELGYHCSEFKLLIRQQEVDPDIDDEVYIKDIPDIDDEVQKYPNYLKVTIKKNPHYERDLHPKFLLAKNQENF